HHFEYWNDYNPKIRQVTGVKMPINYVKEMFCDRVAASKIYQGKNYTDHHPYDYFMMGKPKRTLIHPETSDLLEGWLLSLAQDGEEKTFEIIRNTKTY
ncbi:MAG: catalase, partial [Clostridia bacterium]|nr:catalase [Clostridia bacterium]